MAFGIDTSLVHLDKINWSNFSIWNNNQYPSFAGRYFVCDNLLSQGPPQNLNPVLTWGRAEGSNMQPAQVLGTMNRLAPLQASLKSRQEASGPIGFLNGVSDAKAIFDKLLALIVTGELNITIEGIVNVYLDVASGTRLSSDYWAGWASSICSRVANNLVQVVAPADVHARAHGLQFYAPFLPCICCDFQNTPGGYTPDPNVTKCLSDASSRFPTQQLRCWGFWAKATDNQAYRVPSPPLDWKKFSDFQQPIGDPKKKRSVPVSVLLWRYADYRLNDQSFAGGEKLSVDASDDKKWGKEFMLKIQNWQLPDTPANFVTWGVDTNNLNVTAATPNAISNDTVDGNMLDFFSSYYRPTGYNHLVSSNVIKNLGAAGIKFFPVFEDGQAALQRNYFTRNQGEVDGRDAFEYANTLGQPANTPIYFAIDDPPVFNTINNLADRQIIDDYFGGIRQAYLNYLVNNAPDSTPYAIGVYADLNNVNVLEYCYEKGYASYFWFARYVNVAANLQNVNQNRPWVHSNVWQYAQNQQLPNSRLNVDKNTSWQDEGSWSL